MTNKPAKRVREWGLGKILASSFAAAAITVGASIAYNPELIPLNDFNPGLDRMLDPINDKMGEYVENVERELEKEAQDKYNNKTISKNYSN
ncbi:hypothetical protein CMI43_00665 [Candidatus Pacearchaeota archaeon]|jgi:hypothetical protein|nr:hypothetical protein [Candidatus Pacearchaeota archaeon]|tara:strand:- start:597 stop:869 length:273 start_codon:yes stop_codon:yes gene_type:complete